MRAKEKSSLILAFAFLLSPLLSNVADAQNAKADSIENISPQSVESFTRLAVAERKSKHFKNAAELYVKAFELDKSYVDSAYNAACAYALGKDTDLAFVWLQRAVDAGFVDIDLAREDEDFKDVHADPRWKLFLERVDHEITRESNFWDSAAISVPYSSQLSEDERVAGLSKFWSEIKYNFVFTNRLKDLNWDAIYVKYLPKVKAAKSTSEYYKLLMEMCALLKDGHTNVYPPKEALEDILAMPLIRTTLIENQVIVTEVADPALKEQGLAKGDEIVKVNGAPVKQYAASEISPYVSSSTPQDLEARTFSYQFLAGPIQQQLQLECKDPSGKIFTVTAKRASFADRNKSLYKSTPNIWRMLPGDIAYVPLTSFASPDAVKSYMRDFPEIAKAKAIIFDIRKNGGGSTEIGYEVLKTLADKSFSGSNAETRDYMPVERANGTKEKAFQIPKMQVRPNPNFHYSGKVIVLTSPFTFSAAEDFAVAFKAMKRGLVIGEPTAGSTGQPLGFNLPGGGTARVCTKNDTFPDGTVFVGVGVMPDKLVHPTVKDFRSNIDTVLERAIAEVQ